MVVHDGGELSMKLRVPGRLVPRGSVIGAAATASMLANSANPLKF